MRQARVPSGRCRFPRAKAFTLVELLVVIAIIALLVSILLPLLQGAQELARIAACMANERNLQTAFHSYATEYDNAYPFYHNSMAAYEHFGESSGVYQVYNGYTWGLLVYPYVENDQAYACASWQGGDRKPEHGLYKGAEYMSLLHYKGNPYLGSPAGFTGPSEWKYPGSKGVPRYGGWIKRWQESGVYVYIWYPAKQESIVNPSEKVLLHDNLRDWNPYGPSPGLANNSFFGSDSQRSDPTKYNQPWQMQHIGLWHMGKANITFCDGHIETLEAEDPRCYGTSNVTLNDQLYWQLYQ